MWSAVTEYVRYPALLQWCWDVDEREKCLWGFDSMYVPNSTT